MKFATIFTFALACLACLAISTAEGAGRRDRRGGNFTSGNTQPYVQCDLAAYEDALDAVNATRAAVGLQPFAKDPSLQQAAEGAALARAESGISGHVDDFSYPPPGSTAAAAGAGCSDGRTWSTCCTFDQYHRAGAAWRKGKDNRFYCHIFVGHGDIVARSDQPAAKAEKAPTPKTAESIPAPKVKSAIPSLDAPPPACCAEATVTTKTRVSMRERFSFRQRGGHCRERHSFRGRSRGCGC